MSGVLKTTVSREKMALECFLDLQNMCGCFTIFQEIHMSPHKDWDNKDAMKPPWSLRRPWIKPCYPFIKSSVWIPGESLPGWGCGNFQDKWPPDQVTQLPWVVTPWAVHCQEWQWTFRLHLSVGLLQYLSLNASPRISPNIMYAYWPFSKIHNHEPSGRSKASLFFQTA